MKHIAKVTCIRFDEVTESNTQDHYLSITQDGSGCLTTVGYTGKGNQEHQTINLDRRCMGYATLIHELLHVLGFFHQHNAPNRDEYVRIDKFNMNVNQQWEFEPIPKNEWSVDVDKYDYGSIMHYGRSASSKNAEDTIVPLKPLPEGVFMGQQNGLSDTDIYKINKLYKCPKT